MKTPVLAVVGGVLLGACALAGLFDLKFHVWLPLVVFSGVGGGLAVAAAAFLLRRSRIRRAGLLWIFGIAVAARLLLFAAPHTLSEDAARYHWDGKVLVHGENPYAWPPNARELSHLWTDDLDDDMSDLSSWTLTVYPPLAELLFGGAYLATPGTLIGLQALWLLAEIAAWLLLVRELARWRLPAAGILIAAWNPVMLFTTYLPGHVDALLLPFIALFLIAIRNGRGNLGGLALGLACLIKPFPAILFPAAWVELGPRRGLRAGAVMAGTILLFYLPFFGAGENLFSSMLLMARKWSFNGSVSALLVSALGKSTAHLVCGGLMVGFVLLGARLGRDFLGRCLLACGAFVIFAPTLFPWYLTFIIPVLVLRPDPALIVLCCLAPLSDLVVLRYVNHGVWEQPIWTQITEYAVFYAVLLVGARRRWGMFA